MGRDKCSPFPSVMGKRDNKGPKGLKSYGISEATQMEK